MQPRSVTQYFGIFFLVALFLSDLNISYARCWHPLRHRTARKRCKCSRGILFKRFYCPLETFLPANDPSTNNSSREAVELIFATEFTDSGTYCAHLKLPSGKEVRFCVTCEDVVPRWKPYQIYIGADHPTIAGAREVPAGSEEEQWLIKSLEAAMAPHLTEEGKRVKEKLADKNSFLSRYWQLECAEGMLNRLHRIVENRKK